MTNLIIWAILIIPFAIIPIKGIPEPTRLIKGALFDFTMMGIIVLSLKNGLRFEYKNKYLSWIAIFIFFQFGFNWYFPLLMGYGFNAGTILECVHFLLAVIGTLLFCSFVEKDDFVRIAKAIVFSGTAIAIFGILQGIGLDPMKNLAGYVRVETRHIAATLDHPDLFGNYLALCIPTCLYLNGIKYKVCLFILIVALLMAKSSLSVGAAIIGIMVFLLLKYRNKTAFYSCLSAFSLFGLFCFLNKNFNKFDTGFTGRISAWQEFIKRDLNPLFGNGLGVAKSYQVKIGNSYWANPHNDYISIFLSLGVIGILLFFLLVINAFRNFRYNQDNTLGFAYLASLITFLILMIGSFPMESAPIALIGLISFWAVEKSAIWKSN